MIEDTMNIRTGGADRSERSLSQASSTREPVRALVHLTLAPRPHRADEDRFVGKVVSFRDDLKQRGIPPPYRKPTQNRPKVERHYGERLARRIRRALVTRPIIRPVALGHVAHIKGH